MALAPEPPHSSMASHERARELYKYFRPTPSSAPLDDARGEPDTILISQAQLVAWKVDARRCTINFSDHTTQYCVAEGTRTLHLDDIALHDDPDDFAACNYLPQDVNQSLCDYTTRMPQLQDGSAAFFEVLDLTQDVRFHKLALVTEAPQLKYFCGTPLRTKKGITIGALCVFDDKLRPPMTNLAKAFLSVIARNIITHIELLREKIERKRATKMSRCLNNLVDPEKQSQNRRQRFQELAKPSKKSAASLADTTSSRASAINVPASLAAHTSGAESPHHSGSPKQPPKSPMLAAEPGQATPAYAYNTTSQAFSMDPEATHESRILENDHIAIYRSGAELLRSSLDVEDGGGVVFFDSLPLMNADSETQPPAVSGASDEAGDDDDDDDGDDDIGMTSTSPPTADYSTSPRADSGGRTATVTTQSGPAEILAASAKDSSFTSLSTKSLSLLRRRYPRGKLWVFDAEGNLCPDSDEEMILDSNVKVGRSERKSVPISVLRQKQEARILLHHFPRSCQVIGVPILDTRTSRWTFCFAFTTSRWRFFNYETDFLFTIAFCNCIAIEKSRLATLAADQQKGDFIGSISHELRSPLHGILASCEFLQDTSLSTFQQSLVDTVDSCARTLLDTISMVLDYSKINSFDRDRKRASSASRRNSSSLGKSSSASMPPDISLNSSQTALNIFGNVDLALITEQVVEGVQTGHVFKDINTFQIPDEDEPNESFTPSSSSVAVLVDMEPGNWFYVTQPGAFRRIVMNIVGNALKYTRQGWVKVRLEAMPSREVSSVSKVSAEGIFASSKSNTTYVRLVVADTGVGISPEYLRTKLFEPFSQENTLSPGTGLGLSLVKSILKMLRGQIGVRSTLNSGTTVVVTIPLEKQAAQIKNTSAAVAPTNPPVGNMTNNEDIASLRQEAADRRVCVFMPLQESRPRAPTVKMLLDTCQFYISEWFGLQTGTWSEGREADMVIADESDIESFLEAMVNIPKRPCLVVLCSNVSRHAKLSKYAQAGIIEFISKPFGPYKLAKALRSYLGRTSACGTPDPATVRQSFDALAQSPTLDLPTEMEDVVGRPRPLKEQIKGTHHPFDLSSLQRPDLATRRTFATAAEAELAALEEQQRPMTTSMSNKGTEVAFPSSRPDSACQESPRSSSSSEELTLRQPRLLLVDDNAINLKLLETYAKKRKYNHISLATNGLQAIERFESLLQSGQPPDIVFMDLSMPIMGGLEATRRIREIEGIHRAGHPSAESDEQAVDVDDPRPANDADRFRSLIVALTGLASGKDQAEALGSGIDLYMTKPLSFKELGKLMDNWERGIAERHGAAAADESTSAPVAPGANVTC